MTRRILSVVAAVVGSLIAMPLLWIGGWYQQQMQFQFQPAGPFASIPALLAVLAGVLVLGAVAFTVRWSSLGVIVVGAIHVLGALLGFLLPFQPFGGGGFSPIWDLFFALGSISRELSDGALVFTIRGVGALVGFALLGAGIGAAGIRVRLQPSTATLARVLSATVGALLLLLTVLAALSIGGTVYRAYFQVLSPDVVSALLLIVLAAISGLVMFSVRWSGLGAVIAGAVLVVLGLIAALAPLGQSSLLPPDAIVTFSSLGVAGWLAAVGATLIGSGAGASGRRRARGAAAASTSPEAPAVVTP